MSFVPFVFDVFLPSQNMTNPWNTKQILVTGAGGFIGSQLVERLAGAGAQVRAFVRYNSRRDPGLLRFLPSELASQVELLDADLRDPDAMRAAVKGCAVVFHLGALISIPYSYRHPYEVAETNVMGTLNVLLACRDLGVERLVHTSTSEVYGTARRVPIDESPDCYKPADEVIKAVTDAGLAEVQVRLSPIASIKGND